MGFSGTVSAGAKVDNGLTPQQQAARAKRQRTLDALEEAKKQLQSGSPVGCMDAINNAANILAGDYNLNRYSL